MVNGNDCPNGLAGRAEIEQRRETQGQPEVTLESFMTEGGILVGKRRECAEGWR